MALSSLTEFSCSLFFSKCFYSEVGGGDTCELFVKLSITEPILGDGTWAALYLPISRDIYPYMYLVMSSQIQWVSKSNGGPVFCQYNGIAPVWPGKVCRGYNTTSWAMTTLLLLCQERSILSDPNSATGLIYVFMNSLCKVIKCCFCFQEFSRRWDNIEIMSCQSEDKATWQQSYDWNDLLIVDNWAK